MADTDIMDGFDFTFDPMLDPMGGAFADDEEEGETPGPFTPNVEGRTEFLPPDPDKIPVIENAVKQDSAEYQARPAADRTRQLFEQMRSQRAILVGMVEAARTPASIDQIEQAVEDLRTRKFSLYTTANLCAMMEVAGAFERVGENGEPYDKGACEAKIEVIDGEEYWVPTTAPKVCWLATDAAFAACDASGFQGKLDALFEQESDLLPIYKRVLTMTAADGGAAMSDLSAAVDSNPLIAEPRRFFVQHFVESLERCSAVEWNGTGWSATALGKQALDGLASVEDTYESGEQGKVGSVAAESDGIRW